MSEAVMVRGVRWARKESIMNRYEAAKEEKVRQSKTNSRPRDGKYGHGLSEKQKV